MFKLILILSILTSLIAFNFGVNQAFCSTEETVTVECRMEGEPFMELAPVTNPQMATYDKQDKIAFKEFEADSARINQKFTDIKGFFIENYSISSGLVGYEDYELIISNVKDEPFAFKTSLSLDEEYLGVSEPVYSYSDSNLLLEYISETGSGLGSGTLILYDNLYEEKPDSSRLIHWIIGLKCDVKN